MRAGREVYNVMRGAELIIVCLDIGSVHRKRFTCFCDQPHNVGVAVFATTLDDFVIAHHATLEVFDNLGEQRVALRYGYVVRLGEPVLQIFTQLIPVPATA